MMREVTNEGGQATIEAAFLIPILFLGMLLLLQPGIILYDRLVMNAAASEACRLLATRSDVVGSMEESCEAFVRHRLGSVPPVSFFHVHEGDCSWDIQLEGSEESEMVSVTIRNEVRLLPLLDQGAALLGLVNEQGHLEIEVTCSQKTQPDWLNRGAVGNSPAEWIGGWLS